MNYTYIEGSVTSAKGFTASGVHCGIRKNKSKRDLALIFCEKKCTAAAVYTTNLVKSSPITVTKQNLANGFAQAVICNSGNANTCNADGMEKAAEFSKQAQDFDYILLDADNNLWMTDGAEKQFRLAKGFDFTINLIE